MPEWAVKALKRVSISVFILAVGQIAIGAALILHLVTSR